MKIQYISDLHLEFYKPEIIPHFLARIPREADICVLAGDIGYPFQRSYKLFLRGMHEKFDHVFLTLGNHEFYQLKENKGRSMEEIVARVREIIAKYNLHRVHLLHNSHYDLDNGYRFIGSILWSKISDPRYPSNDYESIYEFDLATMNAMHEECKAYLDGAITQAEAEGKRAVVVTHYLPSFQLNHPKYAQYHLYHQCFSSHSDHLIRPPVCAWIFGHTHSFIQAEIAGVPCMANPFGYPREQNPIAFDTTIEV